MRTTGILFILLLGSCYTPSQAEADTYRAIAPEYATYVQDDPKLDLLQKQRRLDLIETWRQRVGVAK